MRSTLATSHHSRASRRSSVTRTPSSVTYLGSRVAGPHTVTSAPSFCRAKILDKRYPRVQNVADDRYLLTGYLTQLVPDRKAV